MKRSFAASLTTIGLLTASPALAASTAWFLPSNVRVVQKAGGSGTYVLTSTTTTDIQIQTAINQLAAQTTVCTASSPCEVKVMPGTYSLGTTPLQMKPYVNVVGAGTESTIISSTVANSPTAVNCATGTVIMAAGTSLRNLTVQNLAPAPASDQTFVNGIVVQDVMATVEGVNVVVGSAGATGGWNNGVCVGDTAGTLPLKTSATLNDLNIEVHNGDSVGGRGWANCVHVENDGYLTLSNSTLKSYNGGTHSAEPIDLNTYGVGEATVSNCRIFAVGTQAWGMNSSGLLTHVTNTTFSLTGAGVNSLAFYADGPTTFANVLFYTDYVDAQGKPLTGCYVGGSPGAVRLQNAQVACSATNLVGARLINVYDQTLAPLPNQ